MVKLINQKRADKIAGTFLMEVKLLKLAIERLHDEVELLRNQNKLLEEKLRKLEKDISSQNKVVTSSEDDEFLTTKDVLQILGICYNTLRRIIDKGLITPIRINQRRILFSKKMLYRYLQKDM